MRIPIPPWLEQAAERFGDWANVVLWERGRLDLRRLDILIAIGFVGCVAWYAYSSPSPWLGALTGAVAYLFAGMIGLWFLRG